VTKELMDVEEDSKRVSAEEEDSSAEDVECKEQEPGRGEAKLFLIMALC
jgi:hypothetical protein